MKTGGILIIKCDKNQKCEYRTNPQCYFLKTDGQCDCINVKLEAILEFLESKKYKLKVIQGDE